MKGFIKEYGLIIVASIIILAIIAAISPIGNNLMKGAFDGMKKQAKIEDFHLKDVKEIEVEDTTVNHKWQIGSDVYASLYHDGLLHISGDGSVVTFDYGQMPWQDYAESITSIKMDRNVQPRVMEGWFSGLRNLAHIDLVIPESCIDCSSLFMNSTPVSGTITFTKNINVVSWLFLSCKGDITVNYTEQCTEIDSMIEKICSTSRTDDNVVKGSIVTVE